MPTSNPLTGIRDEEREFRPVVDPLRMPGARQIAGATYVPGDSTTITDVLIAQQAQQQEATQAQAAAQQQAVGLDPLTGQPAQPAVTAAPVVQDEDQAGFWANLGRGLEQYFPQTGMVLTGAMGFVADKLGADETAQDLYSTAAEYMADADRLARQNDRFTQAIKSDGSLKDFIGYNVGNMLGSVLESVAVFAAGSAAGGAVGGVSGAGVGAIPGAAVGGGGSLLGKTLIKKQLREAIEGQVEARTRALVRDGATREIAVGMATREANQQLQRAAASAVGGAGALFAASAGRGTGEIVAEAQAAGISPDELDAARVATGAGLYGLAEAFVDKTILNAFLSPRQLAPGQVARTGVLPTAGRVLREGARGGLAEGVTEPTQDSIVSLTATGELPSGIELLDAAAAGATGGGVVRAPAGLRAPRAAEAPAAEPDAEAGADADAAPADQLLLPSQIEAPQPEVMPTGVDALAPNQVTTFSTRAQRLLRQVNNRLQKEGIMWPEADGTPSSDPMQFTAVDLMRTPDDVIEQAMAVGMNTDELSAFRNEIQQAVGQAEMQQTLDAVMDDNVRRSVRMMTDEEVTRFASEMGWSAEQVREVASRPATREWGGAPEAVRGQAITALARIREEARLRGEAEREENFRAHAERLAAAELEAVQREAQARAEEDLRVAAEAERRNLQITQQVLGRDPEAPAPQLPPQAVDRLRQADAQASALDSVQAAALQTPRGPRFDPEQYAMDPPATGDPLVDAELTRAFNRGDTWGVQDILQRHGASGRRGAPAARAALEAFNARVEAISEGSPPFP